VEAGPNLKALKKPAHPVIGQAGSKMTEETEY
jgi:hypothetical protein